MADSNVRIRGSGDKLDPGKAYGGRGSISVKCKDEGYLLSHCFGERQPHDIGQMFVAFSQS